MNAVKKAGNIGVALIVILPLCGCCGTAGDKKSVQVARDDERSVYEKHDAKKKEEELLLLERQIEPAIAQMIRTVVAKEAKAAELMETVKRANIKPYTKTWNQFDLQLYLGERRDVLAALRNKEEYWDQMISDLDGLIRTTH